MSNAWYYCEDCDWSGRPAQIVGFKCPQCGSRRVYLEQDEYRTIDSSNEYGYDLGPSQEDINE